jgi:hypothetical protein
MKPIIVGLHNPYSSLAGDALVPYPDTSAGGRLFAMLNKIDISVLGRRGFNASAHKSSYVASLDRRNLCHELHGGRTQRALARTAANEMLLTFPEGATVILLGREVFLAFNACLDNQLQMMLVHPQVVDGITWRWLPHPSGRSTAYNSPVTRTLAGMLLANAIDASTGE